MNKRGRPRKIITEESPIRYSTEYINDDGSIDIWYYDLEKFNRGPIQVEFKNHAIATHQKQETIVDKNIPLTKQKFYNPDTGKYVGYQRAKSLGLIKNDTKSSTYSSESIQTLQTGKKKRGRPRKIN